MASSEISEARGVFEGVIRSTAAFDGVQMTMSSENASTDLILKRSEEAGELIKQIRER